ncbi:sucrase ferredoxin [Vallicoccus soli]|uniref:sucrase ferredoxin n=1 Tax=Vallicoccus soli TaxID=2339232 RepID=UPI001C499030|nr:sucrase ferredoxin [Vallicoccus soli]
MLDQPVADLPGCALAALRSGEPPAGTATPIRSWVALEHDGPWGRDVLARVLADVLEPGPRARLLAAQREAGLRPLLVRRPAPEGRRVGPSGPPTVLVGSARRGAAWLERLPLTDLRELNDLDPAAVAHGAGGLGEPVDGPVFLVCTHGAKDLCCAVRGRPVASAVARDHPGATWECTHLGGDRFAGNLLVLPDGYLHGQLDPQGAREVAAQAAAGRVVVGSLRGHTRASRWEQVAEVEVRRRTGLTGTADVAPVRQVLRPGEGADVVVRGGGRLFTVAVRLRDLGPRSSRCTGLQEPSRVPVAVAVVEGVRAAEVLPGRGSARRAALLQQSA